ncbi:MAG: hypothetical protein ACE5JP_15145 [Candidatus Bipolaricaulia bacterium]
MTKSGRTNLSRRVRVEVFTCDCYPQGEIVQIVKAALEEFGIEYSLKEYNINNDEGKYSKVLDRYGHPFGFEECINVFVDGQKLMEGKPSVERLKEQIENLFRVTRQSGKTETG